MESASGWQPAYDPNNKTFVDVYKNCLRDTHKVQLLHELVLIGQLGDISREDAEALHRRRIEDMQIEVTEQSLMPTGMMILYPNVFLHVIEGAADTITDVIKTATDDLKRGILKQAAIPVISHDIPSHIFKIWSCVLLRNLPQKLASSHDNTVAQQVGELLEQVIKLAAHLRDIPLVQLETVVQSLAQTSSEILPREGNINHLLKESSILSVEGYIDRYINIKRMTLSEELVWPVPDKLLV